MKIKSEHRKKLKAYLDEFYRYYPSEKYTLFHFVRFFKQRRKKNKDAWIAVSGETGVGKSLFVLMAMILDGRPMSLTDNVAYIPKGDEIMKMFDKLNFQPFLIDEAAREMRSVNWQSKQQQGVNVKAMTDRFKNNIVYLNMPNFNEFTKSMRVGSLHFRIIIPYRTATHARVIVQRKSRNWRDPDPWQDEYANKRYAQVQRKYKEIDNASILKIERSLAVTVMDFIVPNLELVLPQVVQEYERLKEESRVEEAKTVQSTKKNIYKDKYQDLLNKMIDLLENNRIGLGKIKLTNKEKSEQMGVSVSTYNSYKASAKKPEPPKQKTAPGRDTIEP